MFIQWGHLGTPATTPSPSPHSATQASRKEGRSRERPCEGRRARYCVIHLDHTSITPTSRYHSCTSHHTYSTPYTYTPLHLYLHPSTPIPTPLYTYTYTPLHLYQHPSTPIPTPSTPIPTPLYTYTYLHLYLHPSTPIPTPLYTYTGVPLTHPTVVTPTSYTIKWVLRY